MSGGSIRRTGAVLSVVLAVSLLAVAPAAAVGLDSLDAGDGTNTDGTLTDSDSLTGSTDTGPSGSTDSGDTTTSAVDDPETEAPSSDLGETPGDATTGVAPAFDEPSGEDETPPDRILDDSVGAVGEPTGTVTEPEGVTTDSLTGAERLLDSGAGTPSDGNDATRPPGTQPDATAGETGDSRFLESGPATGVGADLPGPAGVAFGFGVVAAASVAAVFRSGVLSGGLSNLAGALATTLSAELAPVAAHGSAFERLPRMFYPLRYSRYDDSDPLDHEARARVFEVVEETPGAYLSEVAEHAGLPLSTTRHHVRVLEREGLLSGAKVRGKRRFYPANATGVELAAALNDDATAALLDAIARLGAASVSDLADELGRDPSTVCHHLQRLEADGIVVRERNGRTVTNKLTAQARSALEPETPAEKLVAPGATAGGAD